MKFLTVIFILFSLQSFSQSFGKYYPTDVINDKSKSLIEQEWTQLNPTTRVYLCKHSPMGIKKAFFLVNTILEKNDLEFKDADRNNSSIPDYVEDMTDYTTLHTAFLAGSGEIKITWVIEKETYNQVLFLLLYDEFYAVYIMNEKK